MFLLEVCVGASFIAIGKIPVARDSLGPVQEGTTMGQIPQNVSTREINSCFPSDRMTFSSSAGQIAKLILL